MYEYKLISICISILDKDINFILISLYKVKQNLRKGSQKMPEIGDKEIHQIFLGKYVKVR
jgi:hypothetical protein